jgi:hypothetical protein
MEPHFDRVRANRKGQSGLVGIQLLNIAEQEDRSIFLGKYYITPIIIRRLRASARRVNGNDADDYAKQHHVPAHKRERGCVAELHGLIFPLVGVRTF